MTFTQGLSWLRQPPPSPVLGWSWGTQQLIKRAWLGQELSKSGKSNINRHSASSSSMPTMGSLGISPTCTPSSSAPPFITTPCGEKQQRLPNTWAIKSPYTIITKPPQLFSWLSIMPSWDPTPNTSVLLAPLSRMCANVVTPCGTLTTSFALAHSFPNNKRDACIQTNFNTFSLREVFNKHPDRLFAFLKHPSYIYQPPLPSQGNKSELEEVVEGISWEPR